jgi:hypothetical protein
VEIFVGRFPYAFQYFANAEAARFTPGIAVHWYSDTHANAGPENLDQTHATHADKFILYTEVSAITHMNAVYPQLSASPFERTPQLSAFPN